MSEVIEWGIRVPLVSNVGILVDVLLVFFVSAMIAGGLLYVNGFVDAYSVLRLFVMTCFAHRFLLITMGFVFTNQLLLLFGLDSCGALVRVGDLGGNINRAAWEISSFIQRFGFMGGRVYSLVNEEMYLSWNGVVKAFYNKRRRLVSLNSDLKVLMRVYCTVENMDKVFSMVQEMVPEFMDEVLVG
jgi:hypothetical protein